MKMTERIQALIYQEIQRTLADDHSPDMGGGKCPVSDVAMARQPIFDVHGNVWGYDLLYRNPSNTEYADIRSHAVATARVIAGGYKSARRGLLPSQALCVKFSESMIAAQTIKLLPREQCVLSVLRGVPPTAETLAALNEVKAAGYRIAVEGCVGQDEVSPFLSLADIVKIDIRDCAPDVLSAVLDKSRAEGCLLLAEKVEDFETQDKCLALGCTLLQGFFFSKPEILYHTMPASSQVERMRIFSLLGEEPVNIEALGEAILHIPMLTVGLLAFVNSAHFAFSSRLTDVTTALRLMGNLTFSRWLCVNVLGTLSEGPVSFEISFLASQRAKFLETLGGISRACSRLPVEVTPQELFLTGLFSLLEALLKTSLVVVLEGVPLKPAVLDALMGKKDSPYSLWLDMLEFYQRGEWDEAIALAENVGLTEADLSHAWTDALGWSSDFFTVRSSDSGDSL
jgi:EAL and modified HD-GYP domain-containing signal transduction protein